MPLSLELVEPQGMQPVSDCTVYTINNHLHTRTYDVYVYIRIMYPMVSSLTLTGTLTAMSEIYLRLLSHTSLTFLFYLSTWTIILHMTWGATIVKENCIKVSTLRYVIFEPSFHHQARLNTTPTMTPSFFMVLHLHLYATPNLSWLLITKTGTVSAVSSFTVRLEPKDNKVLHHLM